MGATTEATAAFDQTVAIEHGMNGAFGGDGNTGEPADQALTNFAGTPAGMLALHVENEILYLKRKLVGVAIRASTPIGQALNAALLITIEDLVAGFARDAKLSAEFRHRLAG